MSRLVRASGITAILVLLTLVALRSTATAAGVLELKYPADPLRSTLGLSFGIGSVDNDSLVNFFDRDQINSWTLRYDYRVWWKIRAGVAITAQDKCHRDIYITQGGENYPIRYSFTSFQTSGEFYIRTQLARIFFFHPHLSVGRVMGQIHVESSGYTEGYDANWQEYRPYKDIRQNNSGWRYALGAQFHFWANMNFMIEGSITETDLYGAPAEGIPAVKNWDNSGRRLEIGILQRF